MADDTYAGKYIWDIRKSGPESTKEVILAEAMKPGDAYRIGTDKKAYAVKSADSSATAGYLGCNPGHDIDTAYSIGDSVISYETGSGTEIWAKYEAGAGPIAVFPGDKAVQGSTDGQNLRFEDTYVDAAVKTDTTARVVGRWTEYNAGHATDMKIVSMVLSE